MFLYFSVACTHDGVDYVVGESIEIDCSHRLVCRTGGMFVTVEQECTYVGQGTINGDPHYLTYDGFWHRFQGTCEYVITKLCESDEFSISAKNDGHNGRQISCVSQVTVTIPDENLKIILGRGRPGTIKINNNMITNNLDGIYYNEHGVKVERIGGHPYVYLTTHGVRLHWDGLYGVQIGVASRLRGRLCGLLGNYNGDPADDLMLPNGNIATSVDDFGNSWLVPSAIPGCTGVGKRCSRNTCMF